MEYRKQFRICVALFLALGVFASSALEEGCFCGQACLHGLQAKDRMKVNFLFHLRCPDTLCRSCGLEKGQTLKAAGPATLTPEVKPLDTSCILSDFAACPSRCNTRKNTEFFVGCETVQPSPIYLQNLSLLC